MKMATFFCILFFFLSICGLVTSIKTNVNILPACSLHIFFSLSQHVHELNAIYAFRFYVIHLLECDSSHEIQIVADVMMMHALKIIYFIATKTII